MIVSTFIVLTTSNIPNARGGIGVSILPLRIWEILCPDMGHAVVQLV